MHQISQRIGQNIYSMKNKFIYLVCVMLMQTAGLSLFAQRPAFNRYNAEGKKEGLWIEINADNQASIDNPLEAKADRKSFAIYKEGKLNGLSFCLSYGNLDCFAVYQDNQLVGDVFCDKGKIWFIDFDCGKNTNYSIIGYDGKRYYPDYKSYCVSYFPNGNIESEGIFIWDNDETPVIDGSRCGEWKFYDKDGKVTTKVF